MIGRIKKAAVIGSGVMGGGIAALLASAGVETLLLDIVPFDLKPEEKEDPAARNRIVKSGFDALLQARPAALMAPRDAKRIRIGNLEDDFQKLAECDWIVEVVVENLKIKQALLKRLETIRRKDAVVSTNTSGIPLQSMSEGLGESFRRHFLGTHFFNPVRYMKLLEIIPGQETLPEVLCFMADFGERILGKGIVWAKDTPNFVGNRIGVQGMVRAMQLMQEEGLSIPEVDAIFGPAMGRPKTAMFKTADLVGLDTLGHVARNTYELVTEDEARESFKVPDFVTAMIDRKLLGKKTRAGFYKTDLTPEWKKVRKVVDPESLEYTEYETADFPCIAAAKQAKNLRDKIRAVVYGDDRGSRFAWKAVAGNLVYAANRIPEIADTVIEIDNAMKWGFNFEMGPFETWDALGVAESVEKMKRDGMKVPAKIEKMIADGNESFYRVEDGNRFFFDFQTGTYQPVATSPNIISLAARKAAGKTVRSNASASLVDLDDGVFCLEFHTKMNALNQEIIDTLYEAVEIVDNRGVGLVIGNQAGGMPGAFSAGADLSQVLGAVKEKRFSDIEQMIRLLQYGLMGLRYAAFPVVAAPYGLTLGGGCEICLAADRIVAHAELYMGLVEIGVGLLPAGGGCLNLWRRFLESIPSAVSDFDLAKLFVPVFMNIATAKVSTSAAEARAKGFLRPVDRIAFNRDYLIGEAKKEVLAMAAAGYAPPIKEKIRVFGESAPGMINAELHNMKRAGFVSDYDVVLAKRIAGVISGGEVRTGSEVAEDVILTLERQAFVDFLKEEKTQARIEQMLKTGKPLRN